LQELDRQRALAHAPPIKFESDLYDNAALLELVVSDPKRIDVTRLR
jgi:hypothetical protein